VEIYQKRAYLK